jgi:uncharacterized membrane protein YkvA (DUF1232 family)
MSFEAPNYRAALRDCVNDYTGAHQQAVVQTPHVFQFFANLFAHEELSSSARTVVAGVLAYFVTPNDVMPEEDLGPFGLLDDLYVAAYAFRLIRRGEVPQRLLEDAWQGEGDLEAVMDTVYCESRAAVGKQGRQALKMAGLS